MFDVYIAVGVIMLASVLSIVLIGKRTSAFLKGRTHVLVSFSSGVFLMLATGLFLEALNLGITIPILLAYAVGGGALLEGIGYFLPHTHSHHSMPTDHTHSSLDARKLLISHAFHDLIHGPLLMSAFILDTSIGWIVTLTIFLNELLLGISQFFILEEAGYTPLKAVLFNGLTATAVLVGLLGSMWFAIGTSFMPELFAFTSGALIHVVFRDLLPSSIRSATRTHKKTLHGIAFVLGIVTLFTIGLLVSKNTHTHVTLSVSMVRTV